jgi:hypothetical protein
MFKSKNFMLSALAVPLLFLSINSFGKELSAKAKRLIVNPKYTSGKIFSVQDLENISNGQPVDQNVCCCQPGWVVYDNTSWKCGTNGKLVPKNTSKL